MNRWLARLCAATAALVATAGMAGAADVVKVGLIADFTGAFANWGSQFQQAVEAFQAVNGKTVKGPNGKEIEIQYVYRDNASAGPDKTKQLAEDLVLREKVKFLAGFDLSPHAMAVADIATQPRLVVIMNAATASITRGSPYYVREHDDPAIRLLCRRERPRQEGLHAGQRLCAWLRRRTTS